MVKKAGKKTLSKTRNILQHKEDPAIMISQVEDHLFLGMKRNSMVIVILAISLDMRLLIANFGTHRFSLELEVHVLMLNVTIAIIMII